MVSKGFYPISVVQAVPHEGAIRFLHPRKPYDVSNYTDVIWAILEHCNGYLPVRRIIERVCKRFPDETPETIRAIVTDLREMGILADSRSAFTHFHLLSSNPSSYSQNLTANQVVSYTRSRRLAVKEGQRIGLNRSDGQVAHLAGRRRSCRNFADKLLNITQIGRLCTTAYSLRDHTSPSAGGLYPLKIYLIVTRDQEDLKQGYYEYDPDKCELVAYSHDLDREQLEYAFNSGTLLHNAPVIVVIAADLQRHSGKYANRGYRYTLLEAGHVAQTLHLTAVEDGLTTLEYGGFLDEVLATELGMQQERELPLITIAVGSEGAEPSPADRREAGALHNLLSSAGRYVRSPRLAAGNRPEDGESFFAASARYTTTRVSHYGLGTATSTEEATLKATVEAYERLVSSEVRIDVTARAVDLRQLWLDPRSVAPLTAAQYAAMPHLQPFDPQAQWQWVHGISLPTREEVLVPVDLVFYPPGAAKVFGRKPCVEANSCGVAAFTNQAEAIRRGLLELVERDALMRNWFGRVPPKQISHDRLPHHWRRRAKYWGGRDRKVYVLEQSTHGVVVVQVAIISDEYPCFVNGAAASEHSFEEAVAKAFHEAELSAIQAPKFRPSRRVAPGAVYSTTDHATLYAYPDHISHIEWLWSGPETDEIPVPTATWAELVAELRPVVVNLNSDDMPIRVVRVLSESLVPMNFGAGSEHHSHPAIRGNVDVASLRLPHYFA